MGGAERSRWYETDRLQAARVVSDSAVSAFDAVFADD